MGQSRITVHEGIRGEAVVVPMEGPIYVIPPEEMEPEISIRADKLAEERDWGHVNLGLVELHAKGYTGDGEIVAILDTGGSPDHPDLKDRFLPDGHRDFTGSRNGWRDVQGHGTHCAGIALASKQNSIGVIGAAPDAKLLVHKVLGDNGSGASSWIAAGIRSAADRGAGVISLSLGGGSPDSATRSAIQYAINLPHRPWVVCAAGNDGGPANSYPGHYPESIAVAATDMDNARARFSTINRENDIAAPGVSILSTLPNNRYGTMSGTSMATPYVAGCLALVRSAIKKAGKPYPDQIALLKAFAETAKDIPPAGSDPSTGWGLINTAALIDYFVGVVTPPPPPPPPPPDLPTWALIIRSATKPEFIPWVNPPTVPRGTVALADPNWAELVRLIIEWWLRQQKPPVQPSDARIREFQEHCQRLYGRP